MPTRSYRRLREEDRHIIYRMRKAGNSQIQIAHALGFTQSAISKELARNCGKRGYRPKQANEKALERQRSKRARERVIRAEVEIEVCSRLKRKHSPEQGAGPSRTSIYNYVEVYKRDGGDLHLNLRINGKRRYRHRNKANRHKLSGRVDIEERPIVVERRLRYGDWEVDLIAGCRGGGHLLSLYERKSRTGILVKLMSKDADDNSPCDDKGSGGIARA